MAKFLKHTNCPKCGSKDNLAIYDDGGSFCFTPGCNYYDKFTQSMDNITMEMSGVVDSIKDRRITEDTCKKYGVTIEYDSSGNISKHHYPYYHALSGDLLLVKTRYVANKKFTCSGISQGVGLFGQNICRGSGKYITITEGELDALAVSEMFGRKWDVVSIRTGSSGARKDIQEQLDWLEGYDNVVLCFDNDAAGKAAIDSVKDLFSPHKLRIMRIPAEFKDACDFLREGRITDFMTAWWDSKLHKPDGIVTFEDIIKEVEEEQEDNSVPYPWEGLNDLTYGFRPSVS